MTTNGLFVHVLWTKSEDCVMIKETYGIQSHKSKTMTVAFVDTKVWNIDAKTETVKA